MAEDWYRRGVELGDARAAVALAAVSEAQGDPAAGMDWRERAAMLAEANLARNHSSIKNAYGEPGLLENTAILVEYADYLTRQDKSPEAERWYRLAAELGDPAAIAKLP
jgi:TPR repeat protein